MAGTADSPKNDEVVEGWRMALLLLGFATVTLLLELFFKYLESVLKKQRGLSIAISHIKNELLYVGFISLLLSAFQNLLAKICMPITDTGPYDRRRDVRRHLLAASDVDYCAPNGQSLWPVTLQHDTHIFIFVVAITHVVYGTLTVYLTLFRVKAWHKWELAAQAQGKRVECPVMDINAKWIYRHWGSNPVFHWGIMIIRQLYLSVNQTLYHNARALFIEKMKLDYDCDFHAVVVAGLEDQLMHTLHPEWYMWLIAVVWYAIPRHAYVSYWMYGISCIITLVIGGKLVDILVQISLKVAVKYGHSVVYGRMESVPRPPDKLSRMSLRNGPRAVANQDIKRRFFGRNNGHRGAAATVGGDSAGATSTGDEDARPDSTHPSYTMATVVDALSSREQAKQVLRSWGDAASRSLNAALRSVRSGSVCASGGSGDAVVDASIQPGIEIGRTAATETAVNGAAAVELAVVPTYLSVQVGEIASPATRRRHSGLARGSAPAALHRQGLARFSSGMVLRASGDGGGDSGVGDGVVAVGGGDGSEGAPPVMAATQPKRGRVHRLLSVILESTSPQKHARSRSSQHEQHQYTHEHNNNHNHHHNHHNHGRRRQNRTDHQLETEQAQNGTTTSVAAAFSPDAPGTAGESPTVSSTTAARRASHEGRGGPRGLRSVFEQFQRHSGYHHDTLMLRRFFHPVSHHQQHASSDSSVTPSSNPSTAQVQPQPQPLARQPAQPASAPATTTPAAAADGAVAEAEADTTVPPRSSQPPAALAKATNSNGSSAALSLFVPGDPASSQASICIVTDDDVLLNNNGGTHVGGVGSNERGGVKQRGLETEAVTRQMPPPRPLQKGRSLRYDVKPLKIRKDAAACPSPGPAQLPDRSEEIVDATDGAQPPPPPVALQATMSCQSGSTSGHRRRTSSWEDMSLGCGLVRLGGGTGLCFRNMYKGTRTSSGRRRVPLWKRACYCGAEFTLNPSEYVKSVIKRNKERMQQSDTRDFFWFGKPNFLIGLFALAYFQNSLSIAICIFTLAGFYQARTTWEGASMWVVVLQLVLDLLLLPIVSLCVLPLYALIQPSGSHCPPKVLEDVVARTSLARTQGRGLGRISADLRGVVRGVKAALARTSLGARGGSNTTDRTLERLPKRRGVTLQRSISGPNLNAGARTGTGSRGNTLRHPQAQHTPLAPPPIGAAAAPDAPVPHEISPDAPSVVLT